MLCQASDLFQIPANAWSVAQVSEWLRTVSLEALVQVFSEQVISGAVLMDLEDADLEKMGVSALGMRKLCLKHVGELKMAMSGGLAMPSGTPTTMMMSPTVTTVVVTPPPQTTVVNHQTTTVNQTIVSADVTLINQLDGSREGNAPLHKAAQAGDVDLVVSLLQRGASPNLLNSQGFSAFMLAAQGDHVAVGEALLTTDAVQPGEKHQSGWTPIHLAAWKGATNFVQFLLSKGVPVNVLSGDVVPPVWYASKYGHSQMVRNLIAAGGDVNAFNSYKDSCLHWAAENGHAEVITLLLEAGANKKKKNFIGKTPSDLAKKRKHKAVLQAFKDFKARQKDLAKQSKLNASTSSSSTV